MNQITESMVYELRQFKMRGRNFRREAEGQGNVLGAGELAGASPLLWHRHQVEEWTLPQP